jgi:L-malate glycosyltransferase
MNILAITDKQDRGETELFIRLSRIVKKITVLSNPEGKFYDLLRDSNVHVKPFKIKSRFDNAAINNIQNELMTGQYDIANAFTSKALACLIQAGKKFDTKIVVYRGVTSGIGYLRPENWGTYLNPRLDGIWCNSNAVLAAVTGTRFLWLKFPAKKAVAIYKGHNPDWYQVTPADLTTLGIPLGSKAICCVSRNSPNKGVDTLIKAFEMLPDSINAHLMLVGDICSSKAIKDLIKSSPYTFRIHLLGYRNDVSAIICASDLVVSASYREGLPRTVIEAICAKTPVVATDAGGTAELFPPPLSDSLVKPGDILSLYNAMNSSLLIPKALNPNTAVLHNFVTGILNPDLTATKVHQWYRSLTENS